MMNVRARLGAEAIVEEAELEGAPTSRQDRSRSSERFLEGEEIHERWEADYLDPDMDRFYDAAFGRIAARLGFEQGAKLLDAGCGYGLHAARLARLGYEVTGTDFSDAALAEARAHIARQELGDLVRLEKGDLLSLPFASRTFDAVLCWGVLMHVPELDRALEELSRVLRPGGKLVIAESNHRSLETRLVDPAKRALKEALGRPVRERHLTERGVEEWEAMGELGGLLVRKLDFRYLERKLALSGLRQIDRFATELTELYTNLPSRRLRRAVHGLNRLYFERVRDPRLALGNVAIFVRG